MHEASRGVSNIDALPLLCVDLDCHPLLVAIIVAVFEQSCLIISDFEKAKEDRCVCQKCMRS